MCSNPWCFPSLVALGCVCVHVCVRVRVPECVCVNVEYVSGFYFPWDADPGIVDMVTVLCTELSFVLKKILFQYPQRWQRFNIYQKI